MGVRNGRNRHPLAPPQNIQRRGHELPQLIPEETQRQQRSVNGEQHRSEEEEKNQVRETGLPRLLARLHLTGWESRTRAVPGESHQTWLRTATGSATTRWKAPWPAAD